MSFDDSVEVILNGNAANYSGVGKALFMLAVDVVPIGFVLNKNLAT